MDIPVVSADLLRATRAKRGFMFDVRPARYDESVTANTVFHKQKIPLLKAFCMSFRIAVKKKGMSTTELSKEFSINQKSS